MLRRIPSPPPSSTGNLEGESPAAPRRGRRTEGSPAERAPGETLHSLGSGILAGVMGKTSSRFLSVLSAPSPLTGSGERAPGGCKEKEKGSRRFPGAGCLPSPSQQQEVKHSPPSPPVCFRLLRIATRVPRLSSPARGRWSLHPLPPLPASSGAPGSRAHLHPSPRVQNLLISCPYRYRFLSPAQD